MRSATRSIITSLGLALAAAGVQAAGTVAVSYVQPDKFADAGNTRHDVESNLKELTGHLEALARRYLSDGQKLNIEVLDIDLAGEMRPSRRGGQDVRIVKGAADWPRIKLRYTLDSAGQPPLSGEKSLADMSYLQRAGGYSAKDPLRYEKRMLAEWFAAQFPTAAVK
jgi:hypothetical protein